MFGLFRRNRPDVEAVRRIRELVAARFGFGDDIAVAVAELRCPEPGCPPVETVVSARDVIGFTSSWRIPKPVAEVTEEDIAALGEHG